ncbi:MAG: anthranilate synthase component I family protein [Bacteroidota bacterium]|nr:anthranilate synthase component I family protein [Bacteroidota bacterium]
MKKTTINTTCKKLLADVFTPVGIYLRLRDRFRDTILLESTDHHVAENSYSFICVNAIGGIEISSAKSFEFKLPGQKPERIEIRNPTEVTQLLSDFMQKFEVITTTNKEEKFAQGLFGYTTYDAVQFFDSLELRSSKASPGGRDLEGAIPLMRYRLYQYVIAINHFKDEMIICENDIPGLESELPALESIIYSKDVPVYPFKTNGAETSNMTDEDYKEMVKKGIQSCHRGDVFQIVLSRRFQQGFTGDEFNVYRALRNINPSPYLFFFDYGDYKLMGSSPEAQLIIKNGKAIVHPIAGTFRRTGNDEIDHEAAELLLTDKKENAEHVMLVDLARNDLSRVCDQVEVNHYKEIQYYSHVIHMVSEVTGKVRKDSNVFELLAKTFPAGTLSGAPKIRAMQLINEYEPTTRSFYGGAIGFVGFDGSCNHAIMIRTFLSRNNTLICQAGAGIVAASRPKSELEEVSNKLNALKNAIEKAQSI